MTSTENKVREIIADELSVDISIVTPAARFVEDLSADSLDVVELIMRFEEEFDIEIPDEEAEELATVGEASAYIKGKAKGGGGVEPPNDTDNKKRTLASIVQRRGQAKFRRELRRIYNNECAITGCNAFEALEAAHIRSYNGSDTNHPTNGLLLRADIHTLFDLHLVTVDTSDMSILLAPQLRETSYKSLMGKLLRTPQNTEDSPSKEALNEHRTAAGF